MLNEMRSKGVEEDKGRERRALRDLAVPEADRKGGKLVSSKSCFFLLTVTRVMCQLTGQLLYLVSPPAHLCESPSSSLLFLHND